MDAIAKFLSYGYGSGYGYGDGSGNGFGDGYGDGDGSGDGSGYGYGDGSGYGSGDGDGDGDGSGYGSGYGSGIKSFNSMPIYSIDGVPTIIYSVKRNIAKSAILQDDLTLLPCYVAKIENSFAHGETIKQAVCDAQSKAFASMPLSDRITRFVNKFRLDVKYYASEFFEWHGVLTGSCKMGREQFCKERGIGMTDQMTVSEFIGYTINSYGGDAIKTLREKYEF